jgi:hypothetical protein
MNKRDIQNYTNYRGIKLMSDTNKLRERVIEHKTRNNNIRESIGFYAKGIYHGSYFHTYKNEADIKWWDEFDIFFKSRLFLLLFSLLFLVIFGLGENCLQSNSNDVLNPNFIHVLVSFRVNKSTLE